MNNIWIFKNGMFAPIECTSFPYAFRRMYDTVKTELGKGKKLSDITKSMVILSPLKDIHGDNRKYTYVTAMDMAKTQGLIDADGGINKKAFQQDRRF
jgi:GMP synthase PP-ATPase subunit